VHVRLFNFDEEQTRCRIEFDGTGISFLADDLLVHLAFRWDVDDKITFDLGLTRKPAACAQTLDALITFFNLTEGTDVIFR
jgi:hypothetical protein